MRSPRLLPAAFRIRTFLLLAALPLGLQAAPLEPLWTYTSGSLGAGREVFSVGTINVGTDGSVAFEVTTHDGAFANQEYRIYWLDAEMNDLADDGDPSNDWSPVPLRPLLIRQDHLVYLQNDRQLRSMTRSETGVITDVAIGAAFDPASESTFMIEQSRHPSVLYLVETPGDRFSFKVHAYAIEPVNNPELLVPTQVGIDNGFLQIVFPTKADGMYQVELSSDLVNWTSQGTQIIGTGEAHTFSLEVGLQSKQFYRVRKL